MIRRVALVLWVAGIAGACGKSDKTGKGTAGAGASGKDGGAEGTDGIVIDAREKVADGEPTVPPPPPTVKPGGKGYCRTEYAPRPTRDPNPMCKIEGGTFVMGAPEGSSSIGERFDHLPQRKVKVSRFYIDQFEVTAAQVAHFLNAAGGSNTCSSDRTGMCFGSKPPWSDSNLIKKDGTFSARTGAERNPITIATLEGAYRYCEWAGKSLVTEVQWEYAARHDPKSGKDLTFPWGGKFLPNYANCDEGDCKDGFNWLGAPVGTFDGRNGRGDGSSPWGVYDMAGNIHEYVSGCYELNPDMCPSDGCSDPTDPRTSDNCIGVARGGGEHTVELLRTWSRVSISSARDGGFRCARRD